MSCLGKNVYVEPLVDVCDADDVLTDVCKFYALDLNICTVEDCLFANQYQITMQEDGRVDALVVWFDVGFDKGLDTKILFSTGPYTHPTHWK